METFDKHLEPYLTNFSEFKRDIELGEAKKYCIDIPVSLSTGETDNLSAISDCIFNEVVTFKDSILEMKMVFRNCIFKEDVDFDRTEFKNDVSFHDCIFEKQLLFKSPTFHKLSFISGQYKKLEFTGNINLGIDYPAELILNDGSYEELHFKCREVNTSIGMKGGYFTNIFVSSGVFYREFNIDGDSLKFELLSLDSCTFNERVDFRESQSGDTLYIHRVTFNQMLIYHEKFKCDNISLSSMVAKQRVSMLSNGNISSVSLNDCDFLSSFECNYYGSKARSFDHYFSCDISGVIRGNIIFEGIIVSCITIGCSNFGNIVFRNTDSHLITIKDFLNYNKLTFANIRLVYERHVLIIFDSNIDKTEFVNIDFRKFDEVVIARSEVSNMILSNSVLPPTIQIETRDPRFGYIIPLDEKIDDNTYHRENYRQLKQAMEKQGNRSAALLYKSKEMHYLRRETKWGWDKFLLNLNYVSNNHGLSWIRGVAFTFSSSLLMFIAFEISLISSHYSISTKYTFAQTATACKHGLDSFAEFLASFPLYRLQSEQADNWKSFFVILIARVLVGYGVYQTIAAFRKYAGK